MSDASRGVWPAWCVAPQVAAVERIYHMFRPLDRAGVRRWITAVNGRHSEAVMAARAAQSVVEEPGDAQLPADDARAAAAAADGDVDGQLQREIAAWVSEVYRGSEFRRGHGSTFSAARRWILGPPAGGARAAAPGWLRQ